MSRIRTIVVDDEPLARQTLADLLRRDPDVEIVAECSDGRSALETIRREQPDLVFLDIEMPEKGGLEVAAELGEKAPPAVVFVTAYNSHAIRAFDLQAIDYVLKPFSDERFFASLERAKRRVRERRIADLASELAGSSETQSADGASTAPREVPTTLERLLVRRGDRSMVVEISSVRWIESEDYYARLHTESGSHLIRKSMTSLEAQLDSRHFVRIHRRYIVRVEAITALRRLSRGAWVACIDDAKELRISRSRRRSIEARVLSTTPPT
jgi:two-component system LytT family response regulator